MPPSPFWDWSPPAGERVTVCGRRWREEGSSTTLPEMNRVRDLHHRGLEVHREEHFVGLGSAICAVRNSRNGATTHDRSRSTDLAPASTGTDARSTLVAPLSVCSSMPQRPASATPRERSVGGKRRCIVATSVFEQAPGFPSVGVGLGVVLTEGKAPAGPEFLPTQHRCFTAHSHDPVVSGCGCCGRGRDFGSS